MRRALAFGFVLASLAFLIVAVSSESDAERLARVSSPEFAATMCQTFVEGQLKAPSSARFTPGPAQRTGAHTFAAAGYVDAENTFGASLRNRYTCDLTYDPATDQWTAERVVLEP